MTTSAKFSNKVNGSSGAVARNLNSLVTPVPQSPKNQPKDPHHANLISSIFAETAANHARGPAPALKTRNHPKTTSFKYRRPTSAATKPSSNQEPC